MGTAVIGQACPKCGGPTWDERKSQFYKPGKPIYKCRDKACGGVIWADAVNAPAAPSVPTAAPAPIRQTYGDNTPLLAIYETAFKRLVEFHGDQKLPLVSPDAIATLAEKLAVTIWMRQ